MTFDWKKETKAKRAAFLEHWDWQRVLRHWHDGQGELGVKIQPLLTEIAIWDPKGISKEPRISWWKTNSIRDNQKKVQRHFLHYPGTRGDEHASQIFRRGETETLHHLWEHRENADDIAAVLIAGSLFSRMGSSRNRYPHEFWPDFVGVQGLAEWAEQHLGGRNRWSGWHYSCTDVLPVLNEDWYFKIDSLAALIRYLADEHANLLRIFRPVIIQFATQPDPFIAKELQREDREEQERRKTWQEENAACEAVKKEELAALKAKHPRYGEWDSVRSAELCELVWSKPTTEIAKDFGISDAAIGKRCKVQGIPKPPPGFWARLEAGVIPHLKGIPVDRQGKPLPLLKPQKRGKPKLTLVKDRAK